MKTLSAITLALVVGSASGQGIPASYTTYGSGCPGTVGVPVLSATGLPVLGASFSIDLSGALPGTIGFWTLGFSNTDWLGLPLPLDLFPVGAPGCSVLAAIDISQAVPIAATGNASMPLAVPNILPLAGTHIYSQWLIADPINPLGLVTTNGGDGLIGTEGFILAPLGGAVVSGTIGQQIVLTNLNNVANDGLQISTVGSTGRSILDNGRMMPCAPVDLSAVGAELTFDACSYFTSGVTPSMRVGCRNVAGNLRLSFNMNVAPIFCTTVSMIFLNDAGTILGVWNCPAGTLATVTASGGPIPQIVSMGVTAASGGALQICVNNPATFTPTHGMSPAITGVTCIRLAPTNCTVIPVLSPVDCFEVRAQNMPNLTILPF